MPVSVAANDFGLSWIELRSMWGKNVTDLSNDEVQPRREILDKYKLRVTDIASPLYKFNWARRAAIEVGPQRDQVPLRLRFQRQDDVLLVASSCARLSDRAHPLLSTLAYRGPEALSRRHQRQAPPGRPRLRPAQPRPAA